MRHAGIGVISDTKFVTAVPVICMQTCKSGHSHQPMQLLTVSLAVLKMQVFQMPSLDKTAATQQLCLLDAAAQLQKIHRTKQVLHTWRGTLARLRS